MIENNTICLRAIEDSDYIEYNKWINDFETNYWRGNYPPESLLQSKVQLQKWSEKSDTQLTIAITVSPKKLIGLIGLRNICNRSRRAEVWIYIGDKSEWGKGYGQSALELLINYSFNELNLHRLWLECDPNHKPAVTCYEKVGFVKEGIHRDGYYKRGRYHDTMVMGLIKEKR